MDDVQEKVKSAIDAFRKGDITEEELQSQFDAIELLERMRVRRLLM